MVANMLSHVTALALLFSLSSATPLWLRPELPDQPFKSNNNSRLIEEYWLPKTITPINYDITLIPYLETPVNRAFTFDGSETILIEAKTNTNLIKMHAYDMSLIKNSVFVTKVAGRIPIPVTSVTMTNTVETPKDDKQFLIIELGENLESGVRYTVDIKFKGKLNDDLDGFYRSTYTDKEGNKKWLAVTQFESTGARRAFPCWDEPSWKAFFTLNIAIAPGFKVLANTPETSRAPVTGDAAIADWTMVSFKNTNPVKMPTYLVAFSINQFDSIMNVKFPKVKLWARPEAVQQGHIANNLAPKIMDYMTDFTQHGYSLDKMDQIAIPDFSAGAMENWGLVTYRETALLYEAGVSTSANRQRIEAVVTHELAHQWFGNIVSPTWWDLIWLNEGFATYFEYHALATVQETWQMERQFILDEMHVVLQSDALDSTHALLVPGVESPYHANAVFDNIAYNKGACMVRFLVQQMGEEAFKKGIKEYLAVREYGNANMDDLWAALQLHLPISVLPIGMTLKQVMDTWTLQAGYPVINMTRSYTNINTGAMLTQNRFMTSPDPTKTYDEQWMIHLTYTGEGSPNFENSPTEGWMTTTNAIISSLPANGNQWVILNLKQVGYYRVNYDVRNWELLSTALKDVKRMPKIDVINRAQIVDDALALARAKYLAYPTALDTTAYLSHESEYMPWAAALRALAYLNDRLNYEAVSKELFEWYMLEKLGPAYSLVNGFTVTEDDSHVMRLKRSLLLSWACRQNHEECNMEAAAEFKAWFDMATPDSGNPIAPDLKSVVYCAGMREGGQTEYDFLFARYIASANVASEQALILNALGCASDTVLLQKYLDESIKDDSLIRMQDARTVITAVYNNPLGVDLALDFLLTNWEKTSQLYASIGSTGRVITGLSEKLNTQQHRDKLQAFLTLNEATLGAAKESIESAIKNVDVTLAWHADHRTTVVNYLTGLRDATTTTPVPSTTTPRPTTTTTPKPDSANMSLLSPLLLIVALTLSIWRA